MEWFLLYIIVLKQQHQTMHTLTSSIYYSEQSLLQTVLLQIEMPVKMDKEKWKILALQV